MNQSIGAIELTEDAFHSGVLENYENVRKRVFFKKKKKKNRKKVSTNLIFHVSTRRFQENKKPLPKLNHTTREKNLNI